MKAREATPIRRGGGGEVEEEEEEGGEEETSPLEVGHNIYILAYKLSEHKSDLKDKLESVSTVEAIKHYAEHTAQIEVGISSTLLFLCVGS